MGISNLIQLFSVIKITKMTPAFFLFHKQEEAKLPYLSSCRRSFLTFLTVNTYFLVDIY